MGFCDDAFLLTTPVAADLYHRVAVTQPIVDYHCHLSPKDIAEDRRFETLHAAWLEGDHYKWRAMRADGVNEERITGSATPRDKFQAWAETVPHTLRNPLFHWAHLELRRHFGIDDLLDGTTAERIWTEANRQLAAGPLTARGILTKMNVALVGTTDDPVDPLDWPLCLARARERGWTITHILNTHEHRDHTGGNEGLRAATGARLLAHAGAGAHIAGIDRGLHEGDVIRLGRSVELQCLDTPGHTRAHLCLLAHGDVPALICGDTLFNAGAGNCHNGGNPELLFETFTRRFGALPDATVVHPGHDYLARNLAFTLDREPDNTAAQALLASLGTSDGATAPETTLGLERRINTFFRLREPQIIERLRAAFPTLPPQPDAKSVFLHLRELRNRW